MRRLRSTLSDSDNIAISVQLQRQLPTGTELGNKLFRVVGFAENIATQPSLALAWAELGNISTHS